MKNDRQNKPLPVDEAVITLQLCIRMQYKKFLIILKKILIDFKNSQNT